MLLLSKGLTGDALGRLAQQLFDLGNYRKLSLLGWPLASDEPDWCTMQIPGARANLAFSSEENYAPPVWPNGPGEPHMQLHLDIGVRDLDAAVADAERLGARLADFQPQEEVRVLLDPAGHPFCLYVDAD